MEAKQTVLNRYFKKKGGNSSDDSSSADEDSIYAPSK